MHMQPSSPKYNKKRPGGILGSLQRLTNKQILLGVFVALNIAWFSGTLFHVSRNRQLQYQQQQMQMQQMNHGGIGLNNGIGTNNVMMHPQQTQPAVRGTGLFGGGGTGSVSGGAASGGGNGAFDDLTARHTLTASGLKISGNVLASTSGRLLISADTIGIGTRLLDDTDKLVVNGPIRLGDAGERPECDNARRGMIWHDFGDPGTSDVVAICAKDLGDSYGWRHLFGSGAGGGGGGGAPGGSSGGLVRNFKVGEGEMIVQGDVVSFIEGQVKKGFGVHYGSGTVFQDGAAGGGGAALKKKVVLAALSPTKYVLVTGGGSGASTALLGTVEGTHVFLKTARVPFGPPKLEHFQMSPLSERAFVVAYPDHANNNVGTVVVGEIVSAVGVPGFSPPATFTEGVSARSLAVAGLSGSTFVLAYNQQAWAGSSHGHGRLVLAAYANKKVVFGEPAEFDNFERPEGGGGDGDGDGDGEDGGGGGKGGGGGGAAKVTTSYDGYSLAALTPERFVVAYRNLKTKDIGLRIGHVLRRGERDTVSLTAEVPITTEGRILTYLVVTAISASRVAVVFADSAQGSVVLADCSGGVLAVGSPQRFTGTKPLSVGASPLSPSSFIITYYTANPWRAVVLMAEANDGTEGMQVSLTESVLSAAYSTHTQVAALSTNTFLAAYYDGGNGDAGTVVQGSIGHGVGVAAGSASAGEDLPVMFAGVSQGHSDLTPGRCYYATSDGAVTLAPTANAVGLAVSDQEIILQGCKNG